MINRTEFTKRFALLLDRFGRTMSDAGIAEYYAILNAELTTEQFECAAKLVYRHDQFWPTPQRFVDAAQGGSARDLAETAWSNILAAAQRGTYPPLDTLDPATRAALKTAPMREIQYADSEAKLARLKREFVAAHQQASGPTGAPELVAVGLAPELVG